MKHLNLPLKNKDELKSLHVADKVLLSGKLLVARDAAHERLCKDPKKIPIELANNFIYYMGPTPTPPGQVIGSAGPTTSHRMDKYTPTLLDLGLAGTIGKGKRSIEVVNSIIENGSVYFITVGGCGALLQDRIKANKILLYEDLGPEAVREIEVEKFPVYVAIDSFGKNIFDLEVEK